MKRVQIGPPNCASLYVIIGRAPNYVLTSLYTKLRNHIMRVLRSVTRPVPSLKLPSTNDLLLLFAGGELVLHMAQHCRFPLKLYYVPCNNAWTNRQ
jgi:hypothetical protein